MCCLDCCHKASFELLFALGGGLIPRLDGLAISVNVLGFAVLLALLLALLLSVVELSVVKEKQLLSPLQSSGKGQVRSANR